MKNQCVQDQVDVECRHVFFQIDEHLPPQPLLPLGPFIKRSINLLLPQMPAFAKARVFGDSACFLQVILKWLLAHVLSGDVFSVGPHYVPFLPRSRLCIHFGAKSYPVKNMGSFSFFTVVLPEVNITVVWIRERSIINKLKKWS